MNDLSKISAGPVIRPVLNPTTFDQLVIFAEMAASSGLVPRDYANKPGAIMIAVQMGSELGLSPMQSIQSIAVINGRPGVWGDGLIGLCRASPLCEDIKETIEGEDDARTATCTAIRRGSSPITYTFSVADAKRAGLWQTDAKVRRRGKDGSWYEAANDSPWFRYPDRMLKMRARGFTLRDAFPDVLRGLKTAEELMDTPPDTFRGTTIESVVTPPPPSQPKPETERDQINREIPMGAKKQTVREWMDSVRAELEAADDEQVVVAIGDRADVVRMLNWLKNSARQELNDLLADAFARVRPPDADQSEAEAAERSSFPGDANYQPDDAISAS